MNHSELFEAIGNAVASGEACVLATVVGHSGSTPREAGAWMLVRGAGDLLGTIGGGSIEYQALNRARAMLADGPDMELTRFELDTLQAEEAGMICGGAMDVLLERITPSSASARAFLQAAEALARGRRCVFVIRPEDEAGRWLLLAGEDAPEPVPEAVPDELVRFALAAHGLDSLELNGERYIVQPVAGEPWCVIFGAGHVGRAVAGFASRVGFRVLVADDRPEFASRERLPEADEVLLLASFEDCFAGIPAAPESYVVIVTRGHVHDKSVLGQALKRETAYVGMIGSKTKRAATYAALRQEGVPQNALEAVHSPIGLAIGAVTPEEIGLAIVAELVQVRAARSTSTGKRG